MTKKKKSEDDKDKQYKMALTIVESAGSVRDVERKINNTRVLEKKRDPRMEGIFREIETSFKNFFGTKVKLDAGARKGKIVIEYSSNEDLDRIMSLIK